ncbi:hypothetical protein [Lujinxingia sediminis]|uniref:hypothetical protein n=1 Tax=Lujinxingia sediminis TaxID=2480984 RepID=UPI0013E351CB|nr:hypothetical protein [Lujinxingia sediminis]
MTDLSEKTCCTSCSCGQPAVEGGCCCGETCTCGPECDCPPECGCADNQPSSPSSCCC